MEKRIAAAAIFGFVGRLLRQPPKRFTFIVIALVCLGPVRLFAQEEQPRAPAADTIHLSRAFLDSLEHADSVYLAKELHSKQIANMRHFDLLRDGEPVTLRIESLILPKTDHMLIHFTIRSPKGKLLWDERWKAEGYFDPLDTLNDATKLIRLKYIIHRFFANENFTELDSTVLLTLFKDARPLDVKPGSKQLNELQSDGGVTYNVFRSRDYFYGLVWLPKEEKFVRLWRN